MPGIKPIYSSNLDAVLGVVVDTLSVLPDIVEDEALDIAIEYEPRIVATLGTIAPPRGSEKFVWSNDAEANARARRWWFANLRKGNIPTDGRHYKRQGRPGMGWDIEVDRDGDNIVIRIFNKWEKSWTVYGRLLVNVKRPPIPGHARTGCQAASPKLQQIFSDMTRDMARRVIKRVKQGKK